MENLRIKFQLTMKEEQIIWQYINNSLFKKSLALKDKGDGSGSSRADVRVVFKKKIPANCYIAETSRLPEQSFIGHILDFSLGGVSLEISDEECVMPGSVGTLSLDFLSPPQKVKIVVI